MDDLGIRSQDPLLTAAEAASLASFEVLGTPDEGNAFAPVIDALPRIDSRGVLRRIAEGFQLDAPEIALVLLLFAAALCERVARCVAQACPGSSAIPVWLAQRLVGGLSADSVAASAALRRYGFVDVEEGATRVEARLALREPIVDRLSGIVAVEPEVAARIARLNASPRLAREDLARDLRACFAARGDTGLSPLAVLEHADLPTIAAAIQMLGLVPHAIAADAVPAEPEARDRLARYWGREAAIEAAALVVIPEPHAAAATADFIDRIAGHVVVAGPRPAAPLRRTARDIADVAEDGHAAARWRRSLGPERAAKLGAGLARVAAQFALRGDEIDALCARESCAIDEAPDGQEAARRLWHAAGRAAPADAVPGVTIVEPAFTWQDLVLPPAIEETLRRIEMHVRHASTVMDDWGFGARMGGRGRGVAVLIAGASGVGKTMAAEVLAGSLDLRMMSIDLSQIISKYVGETSKNVAAAFRLAERCGAVMVWNEGDVIWGARGQVGNATDRHVNAEIGDLLQRIEAFRGFTVVTTNMRQSIDPAFLRRFRFMVDFPMPAENERLRLWRQAFPEAAPVAPLDWRALASLPLSGGSIRNVALGAAFLAADAGGPIDAGRIATQLAEELRKHGQPMPALRLEASS